MIALGKPSNRQEREWYFQRYSMHLPVSGEFVLFNRSWYNRLGVEKVMGFCTEKEYASFFKEVELFEAMLVNSGFIILKYYLDISKNEQVERLDDRRNSPLKQWKISPIDQEAVRYWKDYSIARDEMLSRTNFEGAPWFVMNANSKREARVAIMSHLLQQLDYHNKDTKLVSKDYGLVYSATDEKRMENLF